MTLTLQQGDPRDAGATKLLQASHALMEASFPSENNHYLSISDLCSPDITFFTATENGETLGVGAYKNHGTYGEVKSMFTAQSARSKGIADKILTAIVQSARSRNLATLRLETGNSLHAAHRLYERHGFAYTCPFGDYEDSAVSLFMAKPLAEPAPFTIASQSPLGTEAATLLAASDAALREHYTLSDCESLNAKDLDHPNITFLAARAPEGPLGCVALVEHDSYAEVKRLVTLPAAQGKGVATALMHHLESAAKQANHTTLRLETRAKLTAAAALYTGLGYAPCAPFGGYAQTRDSRFYEKHFA